MLQYIKGDILKAFKNKDINVLAHVCNQTVGMGAGIAKKISDLYPMVKDKDDFNIINFSYPSAELIQITDKTFICNLYAMINPGKPSVYGFDTWEYRIQRLVYSLNELYKSNLIIGIPLVLSGLGRSVDFGTDLSDLDYFKQFVAPHIEHLNLKIYYA